MFVTYLHRAQRRGENLDLIDCKVHTRARTAKCHPSKQAHTPRLLLARSFVYEIQYVPISSPTDQEGARQVGRPRPPSFVTVAIVRASDPSPALSDLSEKRKKEGREDGDDDGGGHDRRRDSACLTQGSVAWKTHVSWNQEDGREPSKH